VLVGVEEEAAPKALSLNHMKKKLMRWLFLLLQLIKESGLHFAIVADVKAIAPSSLQVFKSFLFMLINSF
jgi:hypothetical protein